MQRAKGAKKKANKFIVSSKPADANSSTWYSPGTNATFYWPFVLPTFFVLARHARFLFLHLRLAVIPGIERTTHNEVYIQVLRA